MAGVFLLLGVLLLAIGLWAVGGGAFSACFGRGGFGAWIVWRVVFVVWCVTGFGGWLVRVGCWLVRGVRLSALAVGWRGTY